MQKELRPRSFGFKMTEPALQALLNASEKRNLSEDTETQAFKILSAIKAALNKVKNPEVLEKSHIYTDVPEDDFCIIEWVNGWGRVQFLLGPSNDVVFMDNRERKVIPDIEVYLLEEEDLNDLIVKAIQFIPMFNEK